jgi:hypothetical protein
VHLEQELLTSSPVDHLLLIASNFQVLNFTESIFHLLFPHFSPSLLRKESKISSRRSSGEFSLSSHLSMYVISALLRLCIDIPYVSADEK